jgi:hypothetical protein
MSYCIRGNDVAGLERRGDEIEYKIASIPEDDAETNKEANNFIGSKTHFD